MLSLTVLDFMKEGCNMQINSIDTVYKILACVVSVLTILGIISKFIVKTTKRQLVEHEKFTDRNYQIITLIQMIKSDKKIINVYGKKV